MAGSGRWKVVKGGRKWKEAGSGRWQIVEGDR